MSSTPVPMPPMGVVEADDDVEVAVGTILGSIVAP